MGLRGGLLTLSSACCSASLAEIGTVWFDADDPYLFSRYSAHARLRVIWTNGSADLRIPTSAWWTTPARCWPSSYQPVVSRRRTLRPDTVAILIAAGIRLAPASPFTRKAGPWAWYLTCRRASGRPPAFAAFAECGADPTLVHAVGELVLLGPGVCRPETPVIYWDNATPCRCDEILEAVQMLTALSARTTARLKRRTAQLARARQCPTVGPLPTAPLVIGWPVATCDIESVASP